MNILLLEKSTQPNVILKVKNEKRVIHQLSLSKHHQSTNEICSLTKIVTEFTTFLKDRLNVVTKNTLNGVKIVFDSMET